MYPLLFLLLSAHALAVVVQPTGVYSTDCRNLRIDVRGSLVYLRGDCLVPYPDMLNTTVTPRPRYRDSTVLLDNCLGWNTNTHQLMRGTKGITRGQCHDCSVFQPTHGSPKFDCWCGNVPEAEGEWISPDSTDRGAIREFDLRMAIRTERGRLACQALPSDFIMDHNARRFNETMAQQDDTDENDSELSGSSDETADYETDATLNSDP
ncbi:hypothetical protein BDV25DRAFT_140318 [Aspergillus avenaceus]|uniref:Cyanovirin-N domain-containing protein n=1 Tax=Aspergillus avenaceus TaxID=36643 RepID=A0A5N6TUH5_ASPAV|nr:hypothetical protein BDV25DRAFT_140318 [Aspergillus avenaceus]